jgi:hypothetical protein
MGYKEIFIGGTCTITLFSEPYEKPELFIDDAGISLEEARKVIWIMQDFIAESEAT